MTTEFKPLESINSNDARTKTLLMSANAFPQKQESNYTIKKLGQ